MEETCSRLQVIKYSFAVLFIKMLEYLCTYCFSGKAAPSSFYRSTTIMFSTSVPRSCSGLDPTLLNNLS